MTSQIKNPNDKKKFDLEDRTAVFGENIIKFVKSLADSNINRPLISQIIRSGTSVGANYMEADAASSKKDFLHKIALCKKEAKETMHWLRMIAEADSRSKSEGRKLWQEAREFVLIFSAILRSGKK